MASPRNRLPSEDPLKPLSSALLLGLALSVRAEPIDSMTFTVDGAVCTAAYTFVTDCPRSTLLDILHEHRHIVKYLNGLALVIDTIASGPGWNRLRYSYHYVVYRLSLTLYRVRTDSLVTFELEEAKPSSHLIPCAATVKGYYRLEPLRDGRIRVHYGQTTTMDRKLGRFQARLMKREFSHFLSKMELYIARRGA